MGFLGFITLLVGGAVSGALSYGTYGSLRDKGWGPWKAGATTGLIGGAISGALFWAGSSILPGILEEKGWSMQGDTKGLAGSVFQSDWAGIVMKPTVSGIVAQQLSGLTMQQVKGLDVQLGAYAVDPASLQLVG